MPKRGRPPKVRSIGELPVARLQEIEEALRSHADEASISIYRRMGLATEGIPLRTFYEHAKRIRRQASLERQTEADESHAVPSMEAVRDRLLIEIYSTAKAGGMKAYEMA